MHLPPGETEGVEAVCLDPHDLAISKYFARREKDVKFNKELAVRGITSFEQLIALVDRTPLDEEVKARMRLYIEADFPEHAPPSASGSPRPR